MRIDTQGWDFWYTAKRLFLVCGAVLIAYWIFKPGAPEKATAPLDYSKPVYTKDHAVICPVSLLSDPRADHDINAVMNMYVSPFTMDSKAKKLGCEVWHGGIEVTAEPMGGMTPLVTVNTIAFTVAAHLTNNADGSTRYTDSTTPSPLAPQPESQIKPQPESQPVAAKPVPSLDWNRPIYTTANALVCKLSRMASSLGTVDMDALFQKLKHNGKAAEDFIGCTEYSAGILVTAIPWPPAIPGTSSGIATFPNNPPSYNDYIVRVDDLTNDPKGLRRDDPAYSPAPQPVQAPQEPTAVPVENPNPPAVQPAVLQETAPAPVENPKPAASTPNTAEMEERAVELWNEKRYSEAAPFLKQACNNGRAYTCYYLGSMYNLGQGVAKDTEKGEQLLSKACSLGYERACDVMK